VNLAGLLKHGALVHITVTTRDQANAINLDIRLSREIMWGMSIDDPNLVQRPAKSWRSAGLSFATHILLVIGLCLFGFFPSPKGTEGKLRRAGIVLAVAEAQDETEYIAQPNEPDDSAEEIVEKNVAALPPPSISQISNSQPSDIELPGFDSNDQLTDANQMIVGEAENGLDHQYELTAEELKIIENDRRILAARIPNGNPTTISVFGTGGLHGRSFVFVLDRSKSMGSQGLGVLQAARKELSQAINQLEPNHKFQIVGYHNQTVTMKERRLLPATDENKKAVANFIGGLAAYGATNHQNGLIAAAGFQPDIIVLLTDGGYPDLHDGKLKMLGKLFRGAQVHCVQFGLGSNQKTTNFMLKLANQNQGTFRYIDVTTWNKSKNNELPKKP
jgi:hypothetical protein